MKLVYERGSHGVIIADSLPHNFLQIHQKLTLGNVEFNTSM